MSIDRGAVEVDEREAAEGAAWLSKIEEENADELTPERIAAMEAAAASSEDALDDGQALPMAGSGRDQAHRLDEDASPTGGPPLHPRVGQSSQQASPHRDRDRLAAGAGLELHLGVLRRGVRTVAG